MSNTQSKVANLAKAGVVAGLYVAITLLLAPFSFGAVQQHHVRLDRVELFQPFFAIVGHGDLIALLGQVQPQQLADVGVVIHHKDLFVCHKFSSPFMQVFAVSSALPGVLTGSFLSIIRDSYDKIKKEV